ncbi:MAG TPA: OsmC family protein [Chloroflexota bacterium]|nr:OsmC family protein [Chloroflexota bacterium]
MTESLSGSARLLDGMAFSAESESGHTIVLDAAEAVGGGNRGPRPVELLLLGLAGCTGMDVISILRKMRQDVSGYEVRVVGSRAESHPKVFTEITVEHVVRGRGLSPDSVRRAVELSATRYCPASAMLGKAAQIKEQFRVIDDASGTETTGAL